jgi:glycosyltransferase involved in cell wall biosynthesis
VRILHLISSPSAGGAEVYVKDLAKEMVRLGHQLFIGFVNRSGDIGRDEEYESRFFRELELAGIPYFVVGYECRRNPLLGAVRVRRFCAAHGIEIYHSHLHYALAFGALLRVPHVHTHHNIIPDAWPPMYKLFNLLVDTYIGISVICAEALSNFGGRPVTVIFNAVDASKLKQAQLPDSPAARRLECISVGRIQEQKNFALLVEAIALLPAEIRDSLHVSIAGEGPPADVSALKLSIRRAGLDETITLLGNRDDVPDLLARSQLFLLSSAWEGLPISLLEASVTGLPFIATDVGGCREIAAKCRNGIIVSPGDPRTMASAIEKLVLDRGMLRELAQNARTNSAHFGIQRAAEEHLGLYARLAPASQG